MNYIFWDLENGFNIFDEIRYNGGFRGRFPRYVQDLIYKDILFM